jgi:hypothetical protein
MRKTKRPTEIVRPSTQIAYPSGIAVTTEDAIYFIKGASKFRFFSPRAFDSWSLPATVGSKASLAGFKLAGVLGFRDGTLIRTISDNRLYLISGNKKRLVTSPDVQTLYGLDFSRAMVVSDAEAAVHDTGEVLA